MAQNDPQYVIKRRVDAGNAEPHYLAHVKVGSTWQLQDATSFSPNCLWYSGNTIDHTGTNHNYYFLDGSVYHFLSAELVPQGSIILSDTLPPSQVLRNTEQIYYFYDWDWDNGPVDGGGVARGYQHVGVTQSECEGAQLHSSWGTNGECWEVYWVECIGGNWKLSSSSDYLMTTNSARFRLVTITQHEREVTNVTEGQLDDLADFSMESQGSTHALSISAGTYTYSYIPAYTTYAFENGIHNYYGNTDHGTDTPAGTSSSGTPSSYKWTIAGPGAQYLSFNTGSDVLESSSASPTLYYRHQNNTGHKTAILTLTLTYSDGGTQVRTATVTVKTPCQNPLQTAAPVITYESVIVSWVPTAEEYTLSWKKESGGTWKDTVLSNVSTFTFLGLEYNTKYNYKVKVACDSHTPTVYSFTTKEEPDLLIYGAVFGGGRMADVNGNPEVIIVNCDSIGAVYGGNDIAGEVKGDNGSNIILGVNANDTYANTYNSALASEKVRVNDVYGGGNGYYAYNGSSFNPASSSTVIVAPDASVTALSNTQQWDDPMWTNGNTQTTLTLPSIRKTAIKVTNDQVKIDSLFGGAKNAYVTHKTSGGANIDVGNDIAINGGTIFAVYGGNNLGGGQGRGKHYIKVAQTTTNLSPSIVNTASAGYGRDFGIRYLFGGGNKVAGSTTDIHIEGGQLDTIFGGGNAADVYKANLTVDCTLGDKSSQNNYTFGNTYTKAINPAQYTSGTIGNKTIDTVNYAWDGFSGIYNVRTLFGGNNEASMESVPNINLSSGSVGTVYGGGNAGDMLAQATDNGSGSPLVINGAHVKYGTHVVLNSPTMLVDYLYGGCQISNVDYSTWVEVKNGHVGTVYGGCNVSGDVGSTKVHPENQGPKSLEYQDVYGATYVKASGGVIYKNLFAGSNGFYHCNDGINYITHAINYGDPEGKYIGMPIPTHNETHAIVSTGANIKGNVYAGGNLAPVGFTNTSIGNVTQGFKPYPKFVGWASVRMDGGKVKGDVYGGGNMAAIFGSNEIQVSGGSIGGALYGGNDRLGQMAQITNRILPDEYNYASDHKTPLTDTRTYLSITGRPDINTVYGGGNGAYNYDGTAQGGDMDYCNPNDKPIQGFTFVDINIDGYKDGDIQGGHINTVYGGGNGVTVTGSTTVMLNIKGATDDSEPESYDHVGTIFGGNNLGNLDILADIILLKGQVNTVYGGCNQGAMVGDKTVTSQGVTYDHVGSVVQLRDTYVTGTGSTAHTAYPTAKVSGAVYGGCRMNGVSQNSLVLVERGNHTANIFGGSDISGTIGGTSRVVVTGGTTGDVYGGGNGNYDYTSGDYQGMTAPTCAVSQVDILGGQVGTSALNKAVYGGGYGKDTKTNGNVTVNIGLANAADAAHCPVIYGDIYGGSALGTVNTNATNATTVNFLNGALHGNLYGGGLGRKAGTGIDGIAAKVFGRVEVNISNNTQLAEKCFIDLRDASIFGCNNANGSPQDDVTVNVYKTAYSFDNGQDYSAATGTHPYYAIDQVFGGGNEADYEPENGSSTSTKKATVNIFNCNNTIRRVFGGGNAAAAIGVATNVYGGRFNQVFGGGNGDGGAANIGNGGTNLMVSGGIINQLFGGSNLAGTINGQMRVNVSNSGTCTEAITEFFGGSNVAPIGTSGNPANLVTTIECGAQPVNINTIYGGSNLADITGNVSLNIYGGEYEYVYGGSKGQTGSSADDAADISGNVTLNLYGGDITNAFGGSNVNGNIGGQITVNVLDREGSCSLDVDNVYGASNQTAYAPSNANLTSPVVNVIHIKQDQGIKGNVFGGGNLAPVTANPQVNIGYQASMAGQVPSGYPIAEANRRAFVTGNVYGGGNEAGVTGDPVVNMTSGTVVSGIYGGCNTEGTVNGDINVNIYDGTLGTSTTAMAEGIFGGGKGKDTKTTGDVTVTIGDGTTPDIYADIYGGSAFGQVGASGKLTKVDLKNGSIHGTLYGGGKGDDTNSAEVTGNAQLIVNSTVTDGVYGGCNVNGIVKGDATIGITDATIGDENNANRGIIYGGGLGEKTKVIGNVDLTINNGSGKEIWGDVYGGSAKGLVNCNEAGNGATAGSTTEVTLTKGTIHGDLYGGGHGLDDKLAYVYGPVTVDITDGTVRSVFGGNNLNGTPKNTVSVTVNDGTIANVVGGGNEAAYAAPTGNLNYPFVNIKGGTITNKVIGGGNEADVTGNPRILVENGNFGTSTDLGSGIYGGCNASGTVTGNTTVTINGGTIGVSANNTANIHGGGYGQPTQVTGNVTVNFGNDTDVEDAFPKLYGELYGGSALGGVNTADQNINDNDPVTTSTTVNVYNGTIAGSVYGGGLGQKSGVNGATTDIEAFAYGEIHVNIGKMIPASSPTADPTLSGKANLVNCDVFGCNNLNGSPKDEVYVDIYQTLHSPKNEATYLENDATYAIENVFGGGNKADFAPRGVNDVLFAGHKTHVYLHGCDNTARNVYGGGNAADALGVITIIEGGRFNEVFGGGNGLVTPANIGWGSIGLNPVSGHVNYLYEGSNRLGANYSDTTYLAPLPSTGTIHCGGDMIVDSYFFGTNQAELYGGLISEIKCDENSGSFQYKYVYAGSRWAVIYGDVTLTVRGGTIENLFGGSRGYDEQSNRISADVRKYPTGDWEHDPTLSEGLKEYMRANPGLEGTGGNINLIIKGGIIGEVFGGCDILGNVEGKITVTVEDDEVSTCPLFVGNVYGASNYTDYDPTGNSGLESPKVTILKGNIGGTTNQFYSTHGANKTYEGNIFGGGNFGDATSNPKVIIGEKTHTNRVVIEGNVFGGGNEGNVDGSPQVIIVPKE